MGNELILPRGLTKEEKDLLREVLELMRTGDQDLEKDKEFPTGPVDPEPYLAQLDDLEVVEECDCGCDSIYFKHIGPGKEVPVGEQGSPISEHWMVAEDFSGVPDPYHPERRGVYLFLYAFKGELCELEIV